MAKMSLGRGFSAMLGALALHSVCIMLQSPVSSAAWGWFMNVTGSGNFMCKEGLTRGCPALGQPGYDGCGDANFTCTVVAATGYTCTPGAWRGIAVSCMPGSVSLQCSKNNSSPFQPKSGGACVNLGWPAMNMTQDSTLLWSQTPTCTKTAANAGHRAGAGLGVGAAALGALVLMLSPRPHRA